MVCSFILPVVLFREQSLLRSLNISKSNVLQDWYMSKEFGLTKLAKLISTNKKKA